MRTAIVVTALGMVLGSGPGSTAASAQGLPGEPQVSVYLKNIDNTGRIGGWAGDTRRFAVGEPFTLLLVAGNLARGDTSICWIGGYSSSTLQDLVARYAHVWRIAVTPLEYANGQHKMQVDWARFRTGAADRPVARGTQQLTLNEGDRHVLDLLTRDPAARDCSTRAVSLDVSAAFKEDAALADAMLEYEIWVMHTNSHGEKITRRVVTMGRQGAAMPYGFPSIRFAVPEVSGATRQFDVSIDIGGTVRGRVTADGKILLEVTTSRRDGLTPRNEAPRRAGPEIEPGQRGAPGGRKYLEVTAEETLGITIPAKSGFASARLGDAPAAGSGTIGFRASDAASEAARQTEPIAVVNGFLRVYFQQFFEGHETSLILKVTRVQ